MTEVYRLVTKVIYSWNVSIFFLVSVTRLLFSLSIKMLCQYRKSLTLKLDMIVSRKDRHRSVGWKIRSFLHERKHLVLHAMKKPVVYVTNAVQETFLFMILWPGPLLLLILVFTLNVYINLSILYARYKRKHLRREIRRIRGNVAEMFLTLGSCLHSWRVQGIDSIPKKGGCLIVYHHGTLPIDYMYLVSFLYLKRGVIVESVVDRQLRFLPWVRSFAMLMRLSSPTRDQCIQRLKEGRILGVAPGGGKEAMFGEDWGERKGYAVVAARAQCPVVSMYTANLNFAFSTLNWTKPLFRLFYDMTKVSVGLAYGGLPVPLHTVIESSFKYLDQDQTQVQFDKSTRSLDSEYVYDSGHPKNRLNAPLAGRRNSLDRSTETLCLRPDLEDFTRVCREFNTAKVGRVIANFILEEISPEPYVGEAGEVIDQAAHHPIQDLSPQEVEDHAIIINTVVRTSIEVMKQEMQVHTSYSDCLNEYIYQHQLDFHNKRGPMMFLKLGPSFILLVSLYICCRVLNYFLKHFYAVLMFELLQLLHYLLSDSE